MRSSATTGQIFLRRAPSPGVTVENYMMEPQSLAQRVDLFDEMFDVPHRSILRLV
jgi:hypothetical protein